MMTPAERQSLIRTRLEAAFAITQLEIIDESHLHHGHAGAQSGASHFRIQIATTDFQGLKLIECHQRIYKVVGFLIPEEVHALAIQILPVS